MSASGTEGYCWAIYHLIDRKSTRLNSSHLVISYAVFCLKKTNNTRRFPATVRQPDTQPQSERGRAALICDAAVAASARSCRTVSIVASTLFFFFNDTATTEIYTLSLHDALPI